MTTTLLKHEWLRTRGLLATIAGVALVLVLLGSALAATRWALISTIGAYAVLVTIAALVAGPGLGRIITSGFAFQDQAQVLAGALLVAVMALVLELAMAYVQRRFDPLRSQRRNVRPVTPAPVEG